MRFRLVWPLAIVFGGSAAFAQKSVSDDFESGNLDPNWCPCQVDMSSAPVTFPVELDKDGKPFRIARIEVNDYSLGGNNCPKAELDKCNPPKALGAFSLGRVLGSTERPEPPEVLGPSFFDVPELDLRSPGVLQRLDGRFIVAPEGEKAAPAVPPALAAPLPSLRNPYCMESVEIRALRRDEEEECIQRQELRLKGDDPRADMPHEYLLRFRMPPSDQIADRVNSIRWVIAQWKEKPLHSDYKKENWGPSPYLALRFDDGVMHITVQDEECRCVVAAAPHPLKELTGWIKDGKGGSTFPADKDKPICESSRAGDEPETPCDKDYPHFKMSYGSNPTLNTALGTWTTMTFLVEAGPDAKIVVKQDGEDKVTVTGKIGYRHSEVEETPSNFKIGHYRDYMPFSSVIDIDLFTVAPAPDRR